MRLTIIRLTTMRLTMRLTTWFLLTSAAFAQTSGTIAGKVSDAFGEAVSGASIQAKNAVTGAVFKATSTVTGEYALDQLPPGAYELSAARIRMKRYVRQNIPVQAAHTLRLDITLEDGTTLGTLGDGDRFMRQVPPSPSGPVPRMPDGKPDLSGFWSPAQNDPLVQPEKPDALAWAEAVVKERIGNNFRDLPTARCLPQGAVVTAGRGKFVQTPALLVILSEFNGDTRQVFLDGRAHPKALEPTWIGHSIGHWEGDTLVVDSVGFNDKTWLGLLANPYPHTEMLHVIERYRRPDLGHLELEMTVEDPGALKKPWTVKRVANLDPTDEIMEFVCNENEKDLRHVVK